MEQNPTEKTGQTETTETENNIVVESVEDDMRSHGIDVQESNQEEEAADPDAADQPGKEDEQEKPKKKSRAQRKIERQARELKAKEEEIERLKKEKGQESKPGEDQEEEDGVDPDDIDIDDFETYEEYREAVRKAEEVANTKADATDPGEKEEEAPQGMSEDLQGRIKDMAEDGSEEYENFNEVVKNPDLPLTVPVLEAVTRSENAADIAYYLGTHLDRAKKLAKMDKRAMDKEILRIEIELETKPNKIVRVTSAPDPINPVKGGNSSEGKTLDDNLSYEEHEALLNSKKPQGRGGFL